MIKKLLKTVCVCVCVCIYIYISFIEPSNYNFDWLLTNPWKSETYYYHILKQSLGANSHYILGRFHVKYEVKRKLYLSQACVLGKQFSWFLIKMFICPEKRGLSVLIEAKRPVVNGNSIPINHDFWLIVITDFFFSLSMIRKMNPSCPLLE